MYQPTLLCLLLCSSAALCLLLVDSTGLRLCRYWLADTYEERHAASQEPQNVDKEFLRLWFRQNCDPYNDKVQKLAQHCIAICSQRHSQACSIKYGVHRQALHAELHDAGSIEAC